MVSNCFAERSVARLLSLCILSITASLLSKSIHKKSIKENLAANIKKIELLENNWSQPGKITVTTAHVKANKVVFKKPGFFIFRVCGKGHKGKEYRSVNSIENTIGKKYSCIKKKLTTIPAEAIKKSKI